MLAVNHNFARITRIAEEDSTSGKARLDRNKLFSIYIRNLRQKKLQRKR